MAWSFVPRGSSGYCKFLGVVLPVTYIFFFLQHDVFHTFLVTNPHLCVNVCFSNDRKSVRQTLKISTRFIRYTTCFIFVVVQQRNKLIKMTNTRVMC